MMNIGLLFLLAQSNFIYPELNSELEVTGIYDIKWNTTENYTNIYLLHRDEYGWDVISKDSSNNIILNSEVQGNNFIWNVPYSLNKYNIDNHNFRFVLSDRDDLYSNSLTDTDKLEPMYSEYFDINSNIKLSSIPSHIESNENYILNFSGFKNPVSILIETFENEKWYSSELIKENYNNDYVIFNVSVLEEQLNRIQIKDGDIIRYTNIFVSKPITSTTTLTSSTWTYTTLSTTSQSTTSQSTMSLSLSEDVSIDKFESGNEYNTTYFVDVVDEKKKKKEKKISLKYTYIYIMVPLIVISFIMMLMFCFCHQDPECSNKIQTELHVQRYPNPMYDSHQASRSVCNPMYDTADQIRNIRNPIYGNTQIDQSDFV